MSSASDYPNIPPRIWAWIQTEDGFAAAVRIINETVFNETVLIDNTGIRDLLEEAYRRRTPSTPGGAP